MPDVQHAPLANGCDREAANAIANPNYQRGADFDVAQCQRDFGGLLLERIRSHDPTRPALIPAPIDPKDAEDARSGTITYGALADYGPRFAAGLLLDKSLGLSPGDVVALFVSNVPHAATAFIGALLAGLTCALADPRHTEQELAYLAELVQPKAVITVPALASLTQKALREIGKSLPLVIIPDPNLADEFHADMPAGAVPMEALFTSVPNGVAAAQHLPAHIDPESVAVLCLSSGTTGKCKAVELRHRNLSANLLQAMQARAAMMAAAHPEPAALAAAQRAAPVSDCMLRMARIGGITTLAHALHAGARLVVYDLPANAPFDVAEWFATVQRHGIQASAMSPAMVVAAACAPQAVRERFDSSSLRVVMVAGAQLAGNTQEMCAQKLNAAIVQGYGMTEASPLTHAVPMSTIDLADIPPFGCVGTPLPGVHCVLVNPDTLAPVVGAEEQGEVLFRGPNIMRGYRNNPEGTAAALVTWPHDGETWMRSGDVGVVDARGQLHIVDRIKDVIKCQGVQVPPAELEAVLLQHPHVADAGVVGKPDPSAEELPMAFVVLSPGAIDAAGGAEEEQRQRITGDILAFVAARVASWKQLRGGVRFIQEIPRNASGKVLRRELKCLIEKDE